MDLLVAASQADARRIRAASKAIATAGWLATAFLPSPSYRLVPEYQSPKKIRLMRIRRWRQCGNIAASAESAAALSTNGGHSWPTDSHRRQPRRSAGAWDPGSFLTCDGHLKPFVSGGVELAP